MEEFSQRPPPSPPIASEKIAHERKLFFLDLKENDRGRFLKITEDVAGRRDVKGGPKVQRVPVEK